MQQHIYTSSKGESFLSWHQWALTTLSEAELKVYIDPDPEGEPMSEGKLALYNRWVQEEKIISHNVMEDGVVVAEHAI
jgi:hypothetical protein